MMAGRRDKRVFILEPVEKSNEYGEKETTWVDYDERWARVAPLTGSEFFAAKQINNKNINKITVSFDKYITDKFRVLYQDRIYEIENIINVGERNIDLEMMCSEIT